MADQDDENENLAMTCAAIYLLRSEGACWACKQPTRMFALMALPPLQCHGYDIEAVDEEGPMLSNIEALPASFVHAIAPSVGRILRVDHSNTLGESYWMNHCEHCDAKQGDHFVHGPNGPFWPYDQADMDSIQATRFEGPFTIPGEHSGYSGAMADWRDRRHGVERPVIAPKKRRKPRAKPG